MMLPVNYGNVQPFVMVASVHNLAEHLNINIEKMWKTLPCKNKGKIHSLKTITQVQRRFDPLKGKWRTKEGGIK